MYYAARQAALCNDHDFHVVALLYRGRKLITKKTNTKKTHPSAYRFYPRSGYAAHMHAEMSALRFSKPGDKLVVLRFHKNGQLTMAKPCEHCQKLIIKKQIHSVTYSDWNGNMCEL